MRQPLWHRIPWTFTRPHTKGLRSPCRNGLSAFGQGKTLLQTRQLLVLAVKLPARTGPGVGPDQRQYPDDAGQGIKTASMELMVLIMAISLFSAAYQHLSDEAED